MKSILIVFMLCMTGCAHILDGESEVSEGKIWDFDHQVQFEQHKISDNNYSLIVRSTNRTRFSTLSAFLVRQSFQICKTYGFKIEIVDGIETYNDEKYIKSFIPASLEANIECKPSLNQG